MRGNTLAKISAGARSSIPRFGGRNAAVPPQNYNLAGGTGNFAVSSPGAGFNPPPALDFTLITTDMLVYQGAWKLNYNGIPGEHRHGRGLTGYTVSGTNYLLSATSAAAGGEYAIYEHPIGTPTIPGGDPYNAANYGTTTATKIYGLDPLTDVSGNRLIGDNDLSGDNGLGWDSVNSRLIVTYSEGYGSALGCCAYGTLDRTNETGLGLGRFTLKIGSTPLGFKAHSSGAVVVPQDYADEYLSGNRMALFGGHLQSVLASQDQSMGFALLSISDYTAASGVGQKWTDLATPGAGSTTLTSAAGGFTSGMVGKRIVGFYNGSNFAAGTFTVTGYTNANTITLSSSPTPGGAGSGGEGWLTEMIPATPLVGFWPFSGDEGAGYGRMDRPDGSSLDAQSVDSWALNKYTWTDLVEGCDWIDFTYNSQRYMGVLFVGRSSLAYVGYCNADVVKGGQRYMIGIYDPMRFVPAAGGNYYEIQPDEQTYLTIPSVNGSLYEPGGAKTVTSITSNSAKSHNATDGATLVCTNHGLSTNNLIGVFGSNVAEYNAAFEVYVVDANTVTLRNASLVGNWGGVTANNPGITLKKLNGDAPRILGCKFFASTRMLYILHQIYSGSPGPDQLQLMVSAWRIDPP